jgi:hypothetical protein
MLFPNSSDSRPRLPLLTYTAALPAVAVHDPLALAGPHAS